MSKHLILAILMSGTPAIVVAQNSDSLEISQVKVEESCEKGIFAARSRLEQGRQLNVLMNIEDQSPYVKGIPANRSLKVEFVLEGAAASSVMTSTHFMKAISANVITSCKSVSAVSFGMNHTGWTETFGLISDRVKEFECVEPGVYREILPYGVQICGL